MKDGIVLLDKEWGISSAGALNKLKWMLKPTKIGHAGTLDPAATGLLVCLLGKTTKLADFVQEGRKVYSGTILLGIQTASDDITGEVIAQSDELPTFEQITEASRSFIGSILQQPPAVSALKIDGRRAYQLVREGIVPEVAARQVEVFRFDLTKRDERRCDFVIHCSKGTYIRSIARDLGEALGCFGTLESLRREASLPFSVQDAKRLAETSPGDIRPWWHLVHEERWVEVDEGEEKRISHGDERLLPVLLERAVPGTTRIMGYRRDGVPKGVLLKRGEGWCFGPYFGESHP